MAKLIVHRRINRAPPSRYHYLLVIAAMALFSMAGCGTALVGGNCSRGSDEGRLSGSSPDGGVKD